MRRFFDSANAPLRMTYLEVQCNLADKSEFDCFKVYAYIHSRMPKRGLATRL